MVASCTQSRGSRAHVNKGKPARTKRPACLVNVLSCQTSWTVHEVSLRALWLRIQCSLVELGLPASMTSERIHPCILLTSHSFVILENRTRCSIAACLHPLKPKRKENVKNVLMKLFATFLRMYEMMGLKQCHVVSRKENSWLYPRVPLSKRFIPSTQRYNFSNSNKMYRLSLYLQDFRHYCLGLSPSTFF